VRRPDNFTLLKPGARSPFVFVLRTAVCQSPKPVPENYTAATDPVAQIKTVNLILRKPTAPARKRGLVPAQICIFKEVEKVINIPISGWPPIEPPSLFFFDNFTGGLYAPPRTTRHTLDTR
jgi:hypothetical protein